MNPNDPNHPIYNELEFYRSKNNVYYLHFTLADNPSLSYEARNKIMNRYDPTSVFFKRYVLGQRVVAENLIYNIRDWNILEDFKLSDYVGYAVIADPGENASSTVFILAAITKGFKELHILHEYHHRNADNKKAGIKMPIDYADDFAEFIHQSIEIMDGRYPDIVMTDLDITFQRELRHALDRAKLYNVKFKDALKDKIEDRIKMGISLLWNKKLRFYKKCEFTINSFKSAQYDPDKTVNGKFERYDEPTKGTLIDAVDCVEYAMTYYARKLYRR
jgi:PBSX family phage terminase large subunit